MFFEIRFLAGYGFFRFTEIIFYCNSFKGSAGLSALKTLRAFAFKFPVGLLTLEFSIRLLSIRLFIIKLALRLKSVFLKRLFLFQLRRCTLFCIRSFLQRLFSFQLRLQCIFFSFLLILFILYLLA